MKIPHYKLLLVSILLLWGQLVFAQKTNTVTQQQQWYAFFATFNLSDKYSFQTDFQYIPDGFALGRVGLIRQFTDKLQSTAGYATSRLPVPGSGSTMFRRHEHRPWAQLVLLTPLNKNTNLSHRLRYEMRLLQQVTAGELQEDYSLINRIRIQESLRINFPGLTLQGIMPYLIVSDELMLHIKNNNTHHTFDQNRLVLSLGGQYHNSRLQVGYMNRHQQRNTPEDSYVNNHIFTFWLFQTIDLRKRDET